MAGRSETQNESETEDGSSESSELVLELSSLQPKKKWFGVLVCQTTQQSLRMHWGKACSLLLGAGNYLGKEEKQENHAFSPKDAIWKWPIDLVIIKGHCWPLRMMVNRSQV